VSAAPVSERSDADVGPACDPSNPRRTAERRCCARLSNATRALCWLRDVRITTMTLRSGRQTRRALGAGG